MKAIEFVNNYTSYLEILDNIVKPEYYPTLRKMYKLDPHDLVSPDSYFANDNEALGFIWQLLIEMYEKRNKMVKKYYQLYAMSYEEQFYVDKNIYSKISSIQDYTTKEKFKNFLLEDYEIKDSDIKRIGYYTLESNE